MNQYMGVKRLVQKTFCVDSALKLSWRKSKLGQKYLCYNFNNDNAFNTMQELQ